MDRISKYNNSTIAMIGARGQSVRLPRKNIASFCEKPLIVWSIETALGCAEIDRVILSSDDTSIIDIAKAAGCEVPFVRPAELATKDASTVDVALHLLDQLKEQPETFVLLQPTSPLRTSADITNCIKLYRDRNVPAVASVTPHDKPWSIFKYVDETGAMHSALDSSDPKPTHFLNGAVYVVNTRIFRSERTFLPKGAIAYSMPKTRSIDIDDADDFYIASALMAGHRS